MRSTLITLAACTALVVTGCTAGGQQPAPRSPSAESPATTSDSSAPVTTGPGGGYTSIADACSHEGSVCYANSSLPAGPLPASLTRPLRLPRIPAGQRCPATPGRQVNSPPEIRGVYLGVGPVRPKVINYSGDRRDAAFGIAHLEPVATAGWRGFKTLWAVDSSYTGPVMIRGGRLDAPGDMFFGEGPTASQLIIPSGETLNEYDGTRTAPGATWVHSPGCYGYQVDGPNLSEIIIVSVTG